MPGIITPPDKAALPDSAYPGKWVLLRFSSLGDVVLTTGTMRYLAQRYGWQFAVLTKKAFAPIFENNPHVVELIVPGDDQLNFPSNLGFFRQVALAHRGWGLLDLHFNLRSRLLSLFWKGPKRQYLKFSNERRTFLRSRDPEISDFLRKTSVTQRYALAVEDVPPSPSELLPEVFLTPAEREEARRRLASLRQQEALENGRDTRNALIALHPYTTHQLKNWPVRSWIRLVELLEGQGLSWIVVGQGAPLFPDSPRDLSNQTSLRELAALIGEASTLVTGDSGPLHLASAVNTPVLALFGPTTREWGFFPAGPHDLVLERDLPCRPCSLHGGKSRQDKCPCAGECMSSIQPEEVLDALRGQLAELAV